MTKSPATTPIPVQLSEPEFVAFIFPHLSMPRRGPKCKLGYHRVFDLILGGNVRVPTLTGDVEMTIPPETQNEQLMRLARKGMPRARGSGNGDEFVRLIARLPRHLDDRERELFRELARLNPD